MISSTRPRYWRDAGAILRATEPQTEAPLERFCDDGTAWEPTGKHAGDLVWDLYVARIRDAEIEVLGLPDRGLSVG